MKVNRAHKIELDLNNEQANYMVRACGVARFAYNWGLAEWQRQYQAGEKPSAFALKKKFNGLKRADFPFVTEVTKCAPEQAFTNLGTAFSNFFRNVKQGKKPGYPKFKKRGRHDSFYIANLLIQASGKKVKIPKLGWVRMREQWRFPKDKLLSATVSSKVGRWFISFNSEGEVNPLNPPGHIVGVDVGISHLAVTSDGQVFANPKALSKAQDRLRLLQKSVSRKQKGSNNRKKAVLRLGKQHYRVSNIRRDSLHKASNAITKIAGTVVIEDLNVSGMLKNRRVARALSDAGLSELHRQIEYKAQWRGATVVKADRFYPSTKTCSGCGSVKKELSLSERAYSCEACGLSLDRDLNAAVNLKQYAGGLPVKAYRPGGSGSSDSQSIIRKSETAGWVGTIHRLPQRGNLSK